MKKIMFNDKYGLTKSVLDGRKTMTRREVKIGRVSKIALDLFKGVDDGAVFKIMIDKRARYKVGEVVAVAQPYKRCEGLITVENSVSFFETAGWDNKMFVKADLMPHHIRITNIRVERLQDISDEDCLREGIRREKFGDSMHYYFERNKGFYSVKDAFSILIDKVSSKGTWERNPYCFCYEFELVD